MRCQYCTGTLFLLITFNSSRHFFIINCFYLTGNNRGSYNGNTNAGRGNGNLNGNRVAGSDVGNANGNENVGHDNGNANGNG